MEYAALIIVFVLVVIFFLIVAVEGGIWDGLKSIKNLFKEDVSSTVFFIGLLFVLLVLVGAATVVKDGISIKDILIFS